MGNLRSLNYALIVLLILFMGKLASAQAQNTGGAKAGVLFGFSVPDAENSRPLQMWGVTGSAQILPSISLGGYYQLADKRQGSGGREFTYSIHGVSLTYHIQAGQGDTFFGLQAGITKTEVPIDGEDVIFSPYHYGVKSGYDYSLLPYLTAGFEGSFLRFNKSETTTGGETYNEGSFHSINFLVSLKVKF